VIEVDCNLRSVGLAEDEIRIDAEDALGAVEGLEVRRMFSGWGFYRRGLLFAAAWKGEFRFRTRQDGRWIYEVVDRELLGRPGELVSVARAILARLEAEPAARTGKRSDAARRGQWQRTVTWQRTAWKSAARPRPRPARYQPGLTEPGLGERHVRMSDERAVIICGLAVRPSARTDWARGHPCEDVCGGSGAGWISFELSMVSQARRLLMTRPECTR